MKYFAEGTVLTTDCTLVNVWNSSSSGCKEISVMVWSEDADEIFDIYNLTNPWYFPQHVRQCLSDAAEHWLQWPVGSLAEWGGSGSNGCGVSVTGICSAPSNKETKVIPQASLDRQPGCG